MGLAKYRSDIQGDPCPNGSVPHYAKWIGGPTLAKIVNCPVKDEIMPVRTVYIRSEPDTMFSIPAACSFKGKTVKGYVPCDETGFVFNPYRENTKRSEFSS